MDKQYAIFDMDGTLVDSMVYWKNLAKEYLALQGNFSNYHNKQRAGTECA